MNETLAGRLVALMAEAERLRQVIKERADIPGLLLARAVVDVDGMVSLLERHRLALQGVAQATTESQAARSSAGNVRRLVPPK